VPRESPALASVQAWQRSEGLVRRERSWCVGAKSGIRTPPKVDSVREERVVKSRRSCIHTQREMLVRKTLGHRLSFAGPLSWGKRGVYGGHVLLPKDGNVVELLRGRGSRPSSGGKARHCDISKRGDGISENLISGKCWSAGTAMRLEAERVRETKGRRSAQGGQCRSGYRPFGSRSGDRPSRTRGRGRRRRIRRRGAVPRAGSLRWQGRVSRQ
jgi:hypothetical protein